MKAISIRLTPSVLIMSVSAWTASRQPMPNSAGRGNRNRRDDAFHQTTRAAMDLLFDTCWRDQQAGRPKEFVTGNNDADGVYLLLWVRKNFPQRDKQIQPNREQGGGH